MIDFSKALEAVKGFVDNLSSYHLLLFGLGGFATIVEIKNRSQLGGENTIDTLESIGTNNSYIEDNDVEINA